VRVTDGQSQLPLINLPTRRTNPEASRGIEKPLAPDSDR
jgi:hypothetical protein